MGKVQAVEAGISLLKGQIPKGKISPKTLGWVRPDGVINFQSAELAESYAKNRCVSALHGPKPFERGVLVRGNQVIAEANGDIAQIDMSKYCDKMVGADLYHGHPNTESNTAFPVSLADYLVLVSQRLKKVVAFNHKGEHSTLTQQPQKSLIIGLLPQKWQEKLRLLEQIGTGNIATSEYAKEYAKMFPKEVQKKAEQGLHAKIGIPYGSRSKIAEFDKTKLTINEFNTINAVEAKAKQDGTLARVIHNFWEKVANKLNCKYETNYSSLG